MFILFGENTHPHMTAVPCCGCGDGGGGNGYDVGVRILDSKSVDLKEIHYATILCNTE